jgi:hypothetical protein
MNREPDVETAMFINVAQMCRRFSCLPGPGGVLEQDGYMMMGVGIALDAIAEREHKEEAARHAQMATKMPNR